MTSEAEIYTRLDQLGATWTLHEHPAVATVGEALEHWAGLAAEPVKNLFLKDGSGRYWLVVWPATEPIDLRALPLEIGSKRLRFASAETLLECLGILPGAVSPLAVINDAGKVVRVVMKRSLASAIALAVHPLRATATLSIAPGDLIALLRDLEHPPILIG